MIKPGKPGLNKQTAIRIIGGQWRSRKINVADIDGLRPTANRVRETVFNWLAPYIDGAVCVDLFAGSGALGFEALSRGAAKVVMVETDSMAISVLQHNKQRLQADSAEIIHLDALQWLANNDRVYDVAFLDPPFKSGLLEKTLNVLLTQGGLSHHACIYSENETGQELTHANLRPLKSGQAGQVNFYLHEYCHEGMTND